MQTVDSDIISGDNRDKCQEILDSNFNNAIIKAVIITIFIQ